MVRQLIGLKILISHALHQARAFTAFMLAIHQQRMQTPIPSRLSFLHFLISLRRSALLLPVAALYQSLKVQCIHDPLSFAVGPSTMVSMSQYNEAGGYKRLSLVIMILVSVGSSFRNVENGGGVLHSSSQCKDEM